MFEGLGIFVLVVVAVVIFYLLRAIRMVPQGFNYTVERFGKYVRTLQPGLGLIIPFIDRIGAKQVMLADAGDAGSRDVVLKFTAKDGRTFQRELHRGDRVRSTGRFFIPLESLDSLELEKVEITFDRLSKDAAAVSLCNL